jgi:hypothetical protein
VIEEIKVTWYQFLSFQTDKNTLNYERKEDKQMFNTGHHTIYTFSYQPFFSTEDGQTLRLLP